MFFDKQNLNNIVLTFAFAIPNGCACLNNAIEFRNVNNSQRTVLIGFYTEIVFENIMRIGPI